MAMERYAMADAIDKEIRRLQEQINQLQEWKYELLDEAILMEQEASNRANDDSIALGGFGEQEVAIDLSFENSNSIQVFTGAEATGRIVPWDNSLNLDFTAGIEMPSDDEMEEEVEEPLRYEDVVRDL